MKRATMSLHWVCGPMFAGKSTELTRLANRYRLGGKNVFVVKPLVDNRYDACTVSTHDGRKLPAVSVEKLADVFTLANFDTVICVDEGHMFSGTQTPNPPRSLIGL